MTLRQLRPGLAQWPFWCRSIQSLSLKRAHQREHQRHADRDPPEASEVLQSLPACRTGSRLLPRTPDPGPDKVGVPAQGSPVRLRIWRSADGDSSPRRCPQEPASFVCGGSPDVTAFPGGATHTTPCRRCRRQPCHRVYLPVPMRRDRITVEDGHRKWVGLDFAGASPHRPAVSRPVIPASKIP